MINVAKEREKLQRMTVKKLREKYVELFGEETRSGSKPWLIKRILWRMQALQEGDLSERARRRAEELANDADVRMTPPKSSEAPTEVEQATTRVMSFRKDDRLPPPGTILQRKYKGETVFVKVLSEGFQWEGRTFGSLSAVARAITGTHCNGFAFFRLGTGGQS